MKWPLPPLPEPVRRGLRYVGYPLFALTVLVLALYASLPRARIQERVERMASAALNADVKMRSFGLTLFSGAGIDADTIEIRTRPQGGGEKPQRYVVDDVVVHLGVIEALRDRTDVSFRGEVAGGSVSGVVRVAPPPEDGYLKLDAARVTLSKLPGISSAIGLPVDGAIDVKGELRLVRGLLAQSVGALEIACEGCVLGDGKAKLAIPGDAMMAQGITFPRLRLGTVKGAATVEKGRALIKDFRGHSPDADVELDGYIELRDPAQLSVLHLYLRFRPTDALVKREPTMELMNSMLGPNARRSDGFLGFSVSGTLGAPFALPSREPPIGVTLGRAPAVAAAAPPPSGGAPLPPRFPLPGTFPQPRFAEPATPSPSEPSPQPTPPPAFGGDNPAGGPPPPGPSVNPPPPLESRANSIPPRATRLGAALRNLEESGTPAGAGNGEDRERGSPEGPAQPEQLPQNQRGE